MGAPDAPVVAPGQGETILVVEDNPDVKTVATAHARAAQLPHRARSTPRPPRCARSSREKPIDLVFTDVMLPGDVDGVALAQEIRRLYPVLPIVLTSGYAKALGARHGLPIVRKPYQLSSLSQAIRDNLDEHRHANQAATPD